MFTQSNFLYRYRFYFLATLYIVFLKKNQCKAGVQNLHTISAHSWSPEMLSQFITSFLHKLEGSFQYGDGFLINFGWQILSLGVPINFFQGEICPSKYIGAFNAISLVSNLFPYGLRYKPVNFFRRMVCPCEICKFQNLSPLPGKTIIFKLGC